MSSALEPGLANTGSIRFKRLRLGVLVLGVLVILAFALSSAYDAWRSYRYSLTATDREISNMANAFAEQTAWTLQAVDLLLLDTARWYRRESQEIPPQRLNTVLENRTAGLQQVKRVAIVDAQGNPQHVHVIRPLGMGLDEKAIEAVRQYKFRPAMFQGHPVPVEVNIEVNFRIY